MLLSFCDYNLLDNNHKIKNHIRLKKKTKNVGERIILSRRATYYS